MEKKPLRSPQGKNFSKKRGLKNAGFIALIALFVLIIVSANGQGKKLQDVSLSDVISQSSSGAYEKITVSGDKLEITKKGEKDPSLVSHVNPNVSLQGEGVDYGKVKVEYKAQSSEVFSLGCKS